MQFHYKDLPLILKNRWEVPNVRQAYESPQSLQSREITEQWSPTVTYMAYNIEITLPNLTPYPCWQSFPMAWSKSTWICTHEGSKYDGLKDGSQATPFGSIGDAIEHAQSDAIIALSKGVFDEPVVLRSGILLWGACVAETEVTSSIVSETEAVITTADADTEVRNLHITGKRKGIFVNGSLATAHIEDVVVMSAHVYGIEVLSGAVTVRNVVVRDTQSRQSDGKYGRGLSIQSGASVEVSRSVFTNNREVGVSAAACPCPCAT